MRRLVLLLVSLVLLTCVPQAQAATPRDFFGVAVDGPALRPDGDMSAEAPRIRASGTRNVRVAAYWFALEPSERRLELATFDRTVLDAAREGLTVLPVVLGTPGWAASRPGVEGSPPSDPSTYARFLTGLVARYGPAGSLWRENPGVARRPVRRWQVWNEPNLRTYWAEPNWARGYARLLRAAHDALQRADPGSVVVAAGLTNKSWLALAELYRAGARRSFDVAAVHPYSKTVANVLRIVTLGRKAMRAAGDARKPLLISEMSWSSGKGRATVNYGWEETDRGQALRIRQLLPALAARRRAQRLAGAYWYTWITDEVGARNSFEYSGLRRTALSDGRALDKPALRAWRETLARLTR